jgi:lipopolysaccharide/colanic/teichoic acid biosynthesis glycosyltransferase
MAMFAKQHVSPRALASASHERAEEWPTPGSVPPPPPSARRKRRRGRTPWLPEPVYTFVYRVAVGVVAFIFAVLATVIVGAFLDWAVGSWVMVLQCVVVLAVVWFGEQLRAQVYDRLVGTSGEKVVELAGVSRRRDTGEPPDLVLPDYAGAPVTMSQRALKRLLDVLFSVVLLMLLAPMFIVVALAIRLDSAGPALLIQQRLGRHGRPIRLVRFRTIDLDALKQADAASRADERGAGPADERDTGLWRRPDDRIAFETRVGRFLRQSGLELLPTLVNVLLGDLSLVGPRPMRPQEVTWYKAHLKTYSAVRPGLTGLWVLYYWRDDPKQPAPPIDPDAAEGWSVARDLSVLRRVAVESLRGLAGK